MIQITRPGSYFVGKLAYGRRSVYTFCYDLLHGRLIDVECDHLVVFILEIEGEVITHLFPIQ